MNRTKLFSVMLGILLVFLGSKTTAQQPKVELRIREMSSPEQRFPTSGDATMDFVVEGRVRNAVGVGIAEFNFTIEIQNESETTGTLARLRSSNADGLPYIGVPSTSASGGAYTGLLYQYRYVAGLNSSTNGVINTSFGTFINNPSLQEIGLIVGSARGGYLVPSGIIVTDPLDPESYIPATGAQYSDALRDFFGANDQFTELYRFRYSFTNITPRTVKVTLSGASASTFSTLQGSGTDFAPLVTGGLAPAVVIPMYITIPECPPTGLSPMCVKTFDGGSGYSEAWSTMCAVTGTCSGFPQFCSQDAAPLPGEVGRSGMDSGTLKFMANNLSMFTCLGASPTNRQQFFRGAADTQGAVSPNYFLEVGHQFAVAYARNSSEPSQLTRTGAVNLQVLFRTNGTDSIQCEPTFINFDPRVRYDETSRRWIVTAIVGGMTNQILLAVSESENPEGLWRKFRIDMPAQVGSIDYDNISVDRFAIYITITQVNPPGNANTYMVVDGTRTAARDASPCCPTLGSTGAGASTVLICIEKEQVIPRFGSPNLNRYEYVVFDDSAGFFSTPVVAADPSGAVSGNAAWILASPLSQLSGVAYRKIQWFENSSCTGVSLCGTSVSARFFAASETSFVETPAYIKCPTTIDMGEVAPTCASPSTCADRCLETLDHRVQVAVLRDRQVWGVRQVGVARTSGERVVGSDWFELMQAPSQPLTLVAVQSGRLHDQASGMSYLIPSLWTTPAHDVAIGLSIADPASGRIHAGYAFRSSADNPGTMRPVQVVRVGEDRFGMRGIANSASRVRWGDYSQVSSDTRPGFENTLWFTLLTSGQRTFFKWATGDVCNDNMDSLSPTVTCTEAESCEFLTCNYLHGSGNWRQWIASVAIPPSTCCRGATCRLLTSQFDCVGDSYSGAVFVAATACNAAGNSTFPCCFADFDKVDGVTTADLFAFLNSWFDGSAFANFGGDGTGSPDVSDIFSFFNAWFERGC